MKQLGFASLSSRSQVFRRLTGFLAFAVLILPELTRFFCVEAKDDLFYFADMERPIDWTDSYPYTCTRRFRDRFRSPQKDWFVDTFRAPQESLSPVVIFTNKSKPSPEPYSLHIFNNPGISNGYSVSYGFLKNKECLHGSDPECVASPNFGRVRALVINAERFKPGQDLNYIKDHFLVEDPENLCTILNGGSQYERKFYEAVFLGGYPKGDHLEDIGRNSHVVDGKAYPMEIYMYFVDESIPTMARTTILVVLVEEVKEDNPLIRPVVNAVREKLYDAERRFIENNRKLLRQERMFHDMKESLQHNPYDEDSRKDKSKSSIPRALQTAKIEEAIATDYLETYERMQAVEADLRFPVEDHENAIERYQELIAEANGIKDKLVLNNPEMEFIFNVANDLFNNVTTQSRSDEVFFKVLDENRKDRNKTTELYEDFCTAQLAQTIDGLKTKVGKNLQWSDFLNRTILAPSTFPVENPPLSAHWQSTKRLTLWICSYTLGRLLWHRQNNNVTNNRGFHTRPNEKYRLLHEYDRLLTARSNLNKLFYEHFHELGLLPVPKNISISIKVRLHTHEKDFTKYAKGKKDAKNFVTRLDNYFDALVQQQNYNKVYREDIKPQQLKVVKSYGFEDVNKAGEALVYLRQEQENFRLQRGEIHKKLWAYKMPHDQKRAGDPELKNMGMSEDKIKDINELNPIKVPIDVPFQISWLMPPNGGYFHYHGSSPIPPCFRAQNVIVFKKPIKMSRSQIKTLTTIPVSLDKKRDITDTRPMIHSLRYQVMIQNKGGRTRRLEEVEVPVYNERRNHLFLGEDGVHKNAIALSEKIKALKEKKKQEALNSAHRICPSSAWSVITCFSLLITMLQNFAQTI